jgi:hypothetical protein
MREDKGTCQDCKLAKKAVIKLRERSVLIQFTCSLTGKVVAVNQTCVNFTKKR